MTNTIELLSPSREILQNRIATIFFRQGKTFDHMDFVLDSYSEPWRHYHNCNHILNMLEADCRDISGQELDAIELMIIYHDVVYKIGREKGWNENESAAVAAKQLRDSVMNPMHVAVVSEGILATINHEVPDQNWHHFIGLFLDIDLLAGLGTSAEEFQANTALIQREFEPLYTASEYHAGRVKWAESFLERSKIFVTPQFEKYEAVARENLKALIAKG